MYVDGCFETKCGFEFGLVNMSKHSDKDVTATSRQAWEERACVRCASAAPCWRLLEQMGQSFIQFHLPPSGQ